MHAIVGTSKLNFDNPEDAPKIAGGILSNLSSAAGFVTGSFARSADGKAGRSMVLFETEEQAKAAVENVRTKLPASGPVEIVSLEVFEVVAHA